MTPQQRRIPQSHRVKLCRMCSVVLCLFCGSAVLVQAGEPRDPFLFGPTESRPSTNATPHLTGILWDARSPMAVVDDEPVTVGQTVGGWRIIRIEPDGIVIERDSQTQTLQTGSSFPAE